MNEPTPVETATVDATSVDIEAYRATKSRETTDTPAVDAKPAPVADDAPDPEVEADPELRAEIDKLEPPKDNETPQEKRARTMRRKEAARKGYETRNKNEIARLRRELEEVRRQPPAGRPPEPVRANQPAPRQAETDPNDQEPTFEAFAKAHPDHPDPYAGWTRALAAWDRRQEQRQFEAARRDAQRRGHEQQLSQRIAKHEDAGRSVYADFDATSDSLGRLIASHPSAQGVARVIADELADADEKVGSEVLYRLGKSLDETRAAITAGDRALVRHITRLVTAIHAEAKAKAAAPAPVVTAAPAPHTPVSGAAIAPATFDLAKLDPHNVDINAVRRARKAGLLTRS